MYTVFIITKLTLFVIAILFIKGFSANSCEFHVKMKQILNNEGFHRNLTYSIMFNNKDKIDKWFYNECTVGLDQVLPAGVFVNPDELGELRRSHKLTAIPKNRVNVEFPAEQSTPSSVYIIGKVMYNNVNLWLPVHARYHHSAAGGGMVSNEIGSPKLYLRCPDQRLEICDKIRPSAMTFLCNGSSKKTCSWREIPYTMMSDTLIWDVPIGNTDHFYIVSIGTAVVIVIGSLYLLNIIHDYKVKFRKKRL